MTYPWFEEYCLAKPGAVKEATEIYYDDRLAEPDPVESLGETSPAFSYVIRERGHYARNCFAFQSGLIPLRCPNSGRFIPVFCGYNFQSPHFPFETLYSIAAEPWPHFRNTKDGKSIRPYIDLKLTWPSGEFFRKNFEDDIYVAYDPRHEGWNRICVDGYVPDDVMRRLIDMSYTITFQNMSVKDREAMSGPEKLCPKEEGRRCRLCSIFCPTGNQVKYPWIEEYCLSKADTHLDFKEEWQMVQYMVKWKVFAMQCRDETGRPVITLKLPPEMRESLSREFRDVIPGYSRPEYYLNATHWNSVNLDGDVPDEVLRDMIDHSYAIIRKRGDERRRDI